VIPTASRPSGPPPERPDHTRAVVVGAIAVVLAVILGVLVAESRSDDPRNAATAPTSSSSQRRATTTTTTTPDDLESVVLDIETFVERERGLKFKHHVPATLADDAEFQRQLLSEFDAASAGLTESQQGLIALGLIPPDTDLAEAERSLLSISAVGFYSTKTKELVVRGKSLSPYVREIIAHELTHALDDQWFDLNRPQLDTADDETGFGFLGLQEGNAVRVENAYVASLTLEEQQQAFLEQEQLIEEHPEVFDLPRILLTLLQAPYDIGPPFVEALLADGGQPELDNAFSRPPASSEQLLHPERYIEGDVPVGLSTPTADGPQTNVGVLGELMFREILFDSIPSAAEVQRAITGWGGDAYVIWLDANGAPCLRDTFVGDTPTDTADLARSVQEWAKDHNATVDAPPEGPATFTICA
jgi:hypothetical protein